MAEKHKAKEKYLWSYVDSGVTEVRYWQQEAKQNKTTPGNKTTLMGELPDLSDHCDRNFYEELRKKKRERESW